MTAKNVGLLLLPAAYVFAHITTLVANLTPRFFEITYKLKPSEDAEFIPEPTQIAVYYSWIFAISYGMIALTGVFLASRRPALTVQLLTTGLSLQAFIFWVAMFCFCYEGFLGPMTLHSGPDFDFSYFFQFGFGIFPICLIAIVVPIFFAFKCKRQTRNL